MNSYFKRVFEDQKYNHWVKIVQIRSYIWLVTWKIMRNLHCVKCVQVWSYFWSVFPCIQSGYRKIRTRNNSVFGNFSRSVNYALFFMWLTTYESNRYDVCDADGKIEINMQMMFQGFITPNKVIAEGKFATFLFAFTCLLMENHIKVIFPVVGG